MILQQDITCLSKVIVSFGTGRIVNAAYEVALSCSTQSVLDGFPRTIAQAEELDKMLAAGNEAVTSVVSIMIPDEMIKERIRHRASIEGRADDAKEETINNRIKTYHDKTEPLIEFYKKAGKYEEIDGTGSIEDVRAAIFSVMDKF